MTPTGHLMLTYVRIRLCYGGADDDIVLPFRLSPLECYSGVDAILAANPMVTRSDDAQRREMWSFCNAKYQQYRERHRLTRLDAAESPRPRTSRKAESGRATSGMRP